MDYFEERRIEFEQAVSKQRQERRAEAQKEGAKIKAEADKITDALIKTFPQPEKPAPPPRALLDQVRDNYELSPGVREKLRNEEYRATRAARVEADLRGQRRGQSDELPDANSLVNPPALDWDEIDDSDEDYDDEE